MNDPTVPPKNSAALPDGFDGDRIPLADLRERSTAPAGVGLCLSGGGYRAMLFHVGVLWRLREAGLLQQLTRVSAVSGGSIVAALLGLRWDAAVNGSDADFESAIARPLRNLAEETLDADAIVGGILLPGTIPERLAGAYRDHLFGEATLQQLPDSPRIVLNATNVQSGALWRFSKPYMRDWRVGEVAAPRVPLATAVAASSAFPPVLSPLVLKLDPADFTPGSGHDLQTKPYTSRAVLTDGGVYDNLGLETIWKRCSTVFASDGGAKLAPEPDPKRDWARHSYRVLTVIDDQVRNLRVRDLIDSYREGFRTGAYWGIRSLLEDFQPAGRLSCPPEKTRELASIPTRLAYMPEALQERLINWGYAVCDASLRRWYLPGLADPTGFPYPEGV